MSDGPLRTFRAKVASGELRDDTGQRLAIEKLQLLHNRLANYDPKKPTRVGLGLFGWGREKLREADVPGLYLFGGVGRGKSMLMDMFFETAPLALKRRVHFHGFMQGVHAGMHAARKTGVDDALAPVAAEIADTATLLCFDEMQINDITDAMIVGRLFEALFKRGVVIVTTSNRHPDDLYKDGLNRNLFLPFIALINEKLDVHQLESPTDHRRARIEGVGTYHTPLGLRATAALDAACKVFSAQVGEPLVLPVQGRDVVLPQYYAGVARAGFDDLCGKPLGPADYLAIAAAVKVLVIDDIPILSPAKNNEAKRFVTLIDALYEAKVRLICSAAAEPDALYPEGRGAFEFARTASRLQEMRGADWAQERRSA